MTINLPFKHNNVRFSNYNYTKNAWFSNIIFVKTLLFPPLRVHFSWCNSRSSVDIPLKWGGNHDCAYLLNRSKLRIELFVIETWYNKSLKHSIFHYFTSVFFTTFSIFQGCFFTTFSTFWGLFLQLFPFILTKIQLLVVRFQNKAYLCFKETLLWLLTKYWITILCGLSDMMEKRTILSE